MRLAYLTSQYARAGDTFIRDEVAQLRALGHDVKTFSIRRPPAAEQVGEAIRREAEATEYLLRKGPIRLALAATAEAARHPGRFLSAAALAAKVGTPGLKGRAWPLAYLAEASLLAGRLRALGVEHLHNHIGEGSAAVAMIASALSGIPYSLTIHGPSEFDRPTLLALGEKVRRSAFTAAVTEFGRSQLYRWTDPADWGKIRVVHCGLEPAFLDARPTPIPDAPRLVCVGRLAEQKGQLLLVEAAAKVAAEGVDFELTFVGDGPMRGAIRDRAARLGLGGKVTLAGWKDSDGVRGEILRSRALALPSFAEGLPVVFMEALALHRPVIATYIAGIPELIDPSCGWLAPAGALGPLAAAIREAMTAPASALEAMGREGAARVAARHDARIEAAKLSALFSTRQAAAPHERMGTNPAPPRRAAQPTPRTP